MEQLELPISSRSTLKLTTIKKLTQDQKHAMPARGDTLSHHALYTIPPRTWTHDPAWTGTKE